MANKSSDYQYKIQQLEEMLNHEQSVPENEQFGAHLQHWTAGKPINIDAGAIMQLIEYYKHLYNNAVYEEHQEEVKQQDLNRNEPIFSVSKCWYGCEIMMKPAHSTKILYVRSIKRTGEYDMGYGNAKTMSEKTAQKHVEILRKHPELALI